MKTDFKQTSLKTIVAVVVSCLLVMTFSANAAPAYKMPNTFLHKMPTAATKNSEYTLYVHVPESYSAESSVRFPVLYLLDPWWDFPVVAGAHSGLVYDGVIPAMIIVGIGFTDTNADPNELRNADYTPMATPSLKNSGDGETFLNFLTNNVIPFIDTNYRTEPSYRVLAGSSYGGLFTLFTMFEKPNLFQGHIAISPAVNYNNRWLFQREAQYFSSMHTPSLNTSLYIAIGDHDQLENFTNEAIAFNYIIKDRPYKGLSYKFDIRTNEHHASAKLGAFSQGLSHAFSGYKK